MCLSDLGHLAFTVCYDAHSGSVSIWKQCEGSLRRAVFCTHGSKSPSESDTCFSWYLSSPQWFGVALQPFLNFVAGAPASRHSPRDEDKPAGSRAGLSSPVDAIELPLTCLAKERGVGLLICLALGSRRLQSFPLVICSTSRAHVILHNWCFRSAKNTSWVACQIAFLSQTAGTSFGWKHSCKHILHVIISFSLKVFTEISWTKLSVNLSQDRLVCAKGFSSLYLVGRLAFKNCSSDEDEVGASLTSQYPKLYAELGVPCKSSS